MKVFTSAQIRQIDSLTIEQEPIKSIDLMERASVAIMRAFVDLFSARKPVFIFAGPGNNGGDGIALARHLVLLGYHVKVFILKSDRYSSDNAVNIKRLEHQGIVRPEVIANASDFPSIPINGVVVDSLFGSGLTRPLDGIAKELVSHLNKFSGCRLAIDVPSGLYGEFNPNPNNNTVFRASHTITLQFPKLSFFFPENDKYIAKWQIVDIGLHPNAIEQTFSPYFYVDEATAFTLLPWRNRFDHKGVRGHCLAIAGSKGMYGAAIIAAKSCLKAGAGLVTLHVPSNAFPIIQQALPEAIVSLDSDPEKFSQVVLNDKYSAIAIGPGLGKDAVSVEGFKHLLKQAKKPLVVDADALNILADNPEMLSMLPKGSVITPHLGEFSRLFGNYSSGFERVEAAIRVSKEFDIVIVIKGAYTQVVSPDGMVFFNSTGNPAMATGGSGDSLTGIILSLFGQGLSSLNAAILGVFLHGKAADIALKLKGGGTILASDIVTGLSPALADLNGKQD